MSLTHFKSFIHLLEETLITKKKYSLVAGFILLTEVILNVAILNYVRYTEIDWKAYMQEIRGYSLGERNYLKLKGDTGPLVYPAGFVHFYSALYSFTQEGLDVKVAQYLFIGVYVITMAFVLAIYKHCRSIPTYAIFSLMLSKRLHSIYVLRLFNDGVAMMGLYIAVWCLIHKKWNWSALWFSLGLSIKMNILLFLPAFGFIYFLSTGLLKTIYLMLIVLSVQIWLATPFLITFPREYLMKAFEFKRVFEYQWTVNWRMIPEEKFLSPQFSRLLTLLHLTTLVWFAWTRWSRVVSEDGLVSLVLRGLRNWYRPPVMRANELTPDYIVKVCFTSNLIGILFSRTLHYQFYSWYAHQIVFLAWNTRYPIFIRLILMMIIEYSWNVFPSSVLSSTLLFLSNFLLLFGVWFSDDVYFHPAPSSFASKQKKVA